MMKPEFESEIEILTSSNLHILVEGKKDKAALIKLNIKPSRIITLNKPLYRIVENIVNKNIKEIILLTDLDKAGKLLYSKLRKDLSKFGVRINNRFRNFLFKKTKLTQIEGITTYKAKNIKTSK